MISSQQGNNCRFILHAFQPWLSPLNQLRGTI